MTFTRTTAIWLYFAYVIAVLVAFTFGYNAHPDPHQPDCPTEDSCLVSYNNGEWNIVETTP